MSDGTEPGSPESLEETRARLSAFGPPDTSAPSPWASPGQVAYVPDVGAAAPQWYPGPVPAAPKRRGKSTTTLVVVGSLIGVALIVGFIAMVGSAVFTAVSAASGGIWESATDSVWVAYPGSAWYDESEVLAALPTDQVAADSALLVDKVKESLSDEFGLEWVEVSAGYIQPAENGFGGQSMLYDYSSATWEATMVLDDPSARQRALNAVEAITENYRGNGYLWNDYFVGDPAAAKEQFGAARMNDQALWLLYNDGAIALSETLEVVIIDGNIPTDPSFRGYEGARGSDGSLTVSVSAWAFALLDEADRDEFVERLKLYEGLEMPQPEE